MSKSIEDLVSNYSNNITEYKSEQYNETDTRVEFIDPFFELLGWDITNKRNLSRRFREVNREIGIRVGAQEKRPDYEFRLGSERKFFVEAKKPSVDIATSSDSAFQVRRYGWSAGLKISVLTNFEYLIIYDTTTEPLQNPPANYSRIYIFHYLDYPAKFEDIIKLLSRASVYSGLFDEQFSAQTQNRPSEAIDTVFLKQLNKWRLKLCQDILVGGGVTDEDRLNEASQLFILRILFLRMCEDRGITNYKKLKQTAERNDWNAFVDLLTEADKRFNSGLFDKTSDPFSVSKKQNIRLDSNTVLYIVDSLYFPEAPYSFAVFEPEFLGSVYEQFLIERITVESDIVKLILKPEHLDRDVVATPQPIIERIVQDTIYPTLQNLSASEILKKKVLDPACGSGGFLISAFDLFIDVATSAYEKAQDYSAIYEVADGWQLTFEQKCKLLTNCIYGVDRDYAATEVTKFSLLVKLLENETPDSLPPGNSLLPRLDNNIVFGDALIDNRVYDGTSSITTIGPPLTWGQSIPQKFDYIVANPPYLKTEDMVNLEFTEHEFYKKFYKTAYRQFDKYFLFIEGAVQNNLADGGSLGMIVSRKFLHTESGKKLRQFLSKEAYVKYLIDFGNAQLFEGRTTYTCILYISKEIPSTESQNDLMYELVTTPKEWVKQGLIAESHVSLPRYLVSGDNAWLLPNTKQELMLIEMMYINSVPLGEVTEIYNGIQTSGNDIYVITDWQEVDNDTIVFNKLGQTWRIEKKIVKPFFDEDKGTLLSFYPLPITAYVIYPYYIQVRNNKQQATVIPSAILQTEFPLAYNWLLHNQSHLEKRDIRPRPFPADEWYRYGRDQALTAFENRPKIVVGINSQGNKYVYDDTNTLLASGNTAGECAIAALREPREKPFYDLYFILALLNHKAIEYFCRKRGSPFRGGWYARGTSVLKQIPIPEIDLTRDNEKRRLYEKITSRCKELCNLCQTIDKATTKAERISLDRRKIYLKESMDADISLLYGISEIINNVELPQ